MTLSDTAIKNAKAKAKPFKLTDGKGLYVLIHTNGGKYWRFNYRFGGKRRTLALGVYPDVSLKQARQKQDTARKLIANGVDPSANKKAIKQAKTYAIANTFEIVAREWHQKNLVDKSRNYQTGVLRMFQRDLFPSIGSTAIGDIKPQALLQCLRRIEARGAVETAHRLLAISGQVFRYAVATGRCERDISADLRGALQPAKGQHFAAITEPKQVAELLRAIDGYQGTFVSQCALKLAPMVFVRPGELRQAEWAHIDLDRAQWRYLVTKTQAQHIVPLSDQAAAILTKLAPLTGNGRYVFPSERTPRGDRCMSENTLIAALRRLGYSKDQMTMHGFRAMARTLLDEVLGFRPDFIEHQLAHTVRDPNGRAYNRTSYLAERHKMMQAYSDYLDKLKAGVQNGVRDIISK